MNALEVKEIVRMTLDELLDRELIKDDRSHKIKSVSNRLAAYFNNSGWSDGNNIGYCLRYLCDDPYIDIIYLYYRDHYKLEEIAEVLNKDVSTIKRNKRRLLEVIIDLKEGLSNG